MVSVANQFCLKNVGGPRWSDDDVDCEHSQDDTDVKRQSSDVIFSVSSKVESKIHSEAPTETDETSDTKISSSDGDHTSVDATAREIASMGGGLSGLTTVMLRNVPPWYSQHGLMAELNRSGFSGSFDFFYLPLALRSKRNRGFAFINFCEPELAEKFYMRYHSRFLRNFWEPTSEPLLILPADVQGFEASAQAARATRQPKSGGVTLRLPVLLRALPSTLEPMSLEELARRAKSLEMEPQDEFCQSRSPSLRQCPSKFSRTPMVAEPQAQRFCTYCGGERPATGCYCPYCGRQFTLIGADTSVTNDAHCQN